MLSACSPSAGGSFSVIDCCSSAHRAGVRPCVYPDTPGVGGVIGIYLAYFFGAGPIARNRPLISRIWARTVRRVSTCPPVQIPCLKLPLRLPRGPPEPLAL